MSLTIRTKRSGKLVTGYEVIGSTTEREPQITMLTTVLRELTPYGINTPKLLPTRQAMAAVSLQLAALLNGWDGNPQMRREAIAALDAIHVYLLHCGQPLPGTTPLTDAEELEAGYKLTEGYDYFGYDWDSLFSSTA